jgi:DNA-binding CsgD family transcriptional regulator
MRAVPARELYNHGMRTPLYVPPGFLLVSLIQGMALGAMYVPLSLSPTLQKLPLNLGAFALGTVLLFFTGLWVKMAFNHLVFRVGIPLMALGFFVISLTGYLLPVGIAVLNMGYCYLYLIMCCLCAYLARAHDQSPLWVVGSGTACLLIGQLVGELLAYLPIQQTGLLIESMAFGLVLVALYMTSGDIAYGWGRIRPGVDEFLSDALAATCKVLTDEYGLSRREAEVLALLVRGRTRKSISEQLDVSEETVKSHTTNIYNKLLVHSRTELLDLVEQRASSRGALWSD